MVLNFGIRLGFGFLLGLLSGTILRPPWPFPGDPLPLPIISPHALCRQVIRPFLLKLFAAACVLDSVGAMTASLPPQDNAQCGTRSPVQWLYGAWGQSCTTVCSAVGQSCDQTTLNAHRVTGARIVSRRWPTTSGRPAGLRIIAGQGGPHLTGTGTVLPVLALAVPAVPAVPAQPAVLAPTGHLREHVPLALQL